MQENFKDDQLLGAAAAILTGLNESIDKSDYREVSRAFDTVYGAFSPVSTFYKSLIKTNGSYKADLEQIRKHLLAIDGIWNDMKSELDDTI